MTYLPSFNRLKNPSHSSTKAKDTFLPLKSITWNFIQIFTDSISKIPPSFSHHWIMTHFHLWHSFFYVIFYNFLKFLFSQLRFKKFPTDFISGTKNINISPRLLTPVSLSLSLVLMQNSYQNQLLWSHLNNIFLKGHLSYTHMVRHHHHNKNGVNLKWMMPFFLKPTNNKKTHTNALNTYLNTSVYICAEDVTVYRFFCCCFFIPFSRCLFYYMAGDYTFNSDNLLSHRLSSSSLNTKISWCAQTTTLFVV